MGDKNKNPQYKGEVKREYIVFGDYTIEGLGSLTLPNGEKYVGEFKDGKRYGQGTVTIPNGSKYENGTQTSYGQTWAVGDTISTLFDTDSNELTFYKNGMTDLKPKLMRLVRFRNVLNCQLQY